MAASFDDKVEALKKLREKRLARKEADKAEPDADKTPVNAWSDETEGQDAKAVKEEAEERAAFEGSAAGGNADAQYCMGHYAEEQSDFKKAAEWYKLAASDGHAAAQWRLGHIYEHGLAGETSEIRAAHWYMQAAANGHAQAQFCIAVCLEEGRGMTEDNRSALNWHLAAAGQGHKMSMFCVGSMYEEGRGTKRCVKQAKEWYAKAVEAGFHPAEDALADLENEPEEEAQEDEAQQAISSGAAADAGGNVTEEAGSSGKSFAERLAELQEQNPETELGDAEFGEMISSYDFGAMPGGGDQLSELASRVAAALQNVDDEDATRLLDQLMNDDPEINCDDDLQSSLNAMLYGGARGAPAA